MLSKGSDIISLSPIRKHQIVEQTKVAMGDEAHSYAYSGATLCDILCTMLCNGKKATVVSFEVDPSRIDAEKAKHGPHAEGGFVRTNDVIASSFANATSARVLMMPLNYRNRLPEFIDTDAGNYEGVIVMDLVITIHLI
jgi:hypothetical protein